MADTLAHAVALGGVTSPDASAVLGLYILVQVDGIPLPSLPPAPGSADPCPPAITDGEFSLDEGPRTPQGYTLSVASSRACDPGGIPTDVTPVAMDAGLWSINDRRISFTSSPYNRKGSYQGTVQTVSPVPIASVPLGGHTYAFRRLDTSRALLGYVTVFVVDQQGARVAGALMVFHSSDDIVVRGISGTTGTPLIEGAAHPAP